MVSPVILFGASLLFVAEVSSFIVRSSNQGVAAPSSMSGSSLTKSPRSFSSPFSGSVSADVDTEENDGVSANPWYGVGRISKLLRSEPNKCLSVDENEARKKKKIEEWRLAYSKPLKWGDRQAVPDIPVWATPRVLDGGFVNGELLAQLQDDDVPNKYYLTTTGLEELNEMLKSGCYRIHVPEHGALLMVAWLLDNERIGAAEAILNEISPYFHRLRFYPDKVETPMDFMTESSLFASSVGDVKHTLLHYIDYSPHLQAKVAQRKAHKDWLPLKWKLLELWAETCVDGKPGEQFPKGWKTRAAILASEFDELAERDQSTNARRSRKGSTSDMVTYIRMILDKGVKDLSLSAKLRIQAILSGNAEKHGMAGSEEFTDYQKHVQKSSPKDETPQIKKLIDRLAEEASELGLRPGILEEILSDSPEKYHRLLNRTRMGSLEDLIKHGQLPSAEAVSTMIPYLMALTVNRNLPDEPIRRLGYALDAAFSARGSVILFNLQSQIRFEELPWVLPLLAYRQGTDFSEEAKATLKLIVSETISAFPHTILPNKLLQSMRTLVDSANMDLPLTNELAADIFMGGFSGKFEKSAHLASETLAGSIYDRYYGLNYTGIARSPLSSCSSRGSVISNRHMIERQQIITTHNLAACYSRLNLDLDGRKLALKVWDWILTKLARNNPCDYNVQKDVGYAWRQLLFFVSIADDTDGLVELMRDRVSDKRDGWQAWSIEDIFLTPLEETIHGTKPDFVLLGCTVEKHPLELAWKTEGVATTEGAAFKSSLFKHALRV